jgi:hypothetical protein
MNYNRVGDSLTAFPSHTSRHIFYIPHTFIKLVPCLVRSTVRRLALVLPEADLNGIGIIGAVELDQVIDSFDSLVGACH